MLGLIQCVSVQCLCFHQIILHRGIIFAVLNCGNLYTAYFLHDRQHLSLRFPELFLLLSRSSNSTPFSGSPDDLSVLLSNHFSLCSIIFHSHFWIPWVSFTSNVTSAVRRYPFGACSSRRYIYRLAVFRYSVLPLGSPALYYLIILIENRQFRTWNLNSPVISVLLISTFVTSSFISYF